MISAPRPELELLEARKRLDEAVRGLTERRRSRTYRAVGYTTAPVLKTGWATGPVPLRPQRTGTVSSPNDVLSRQLVWVSTRRREAGYQRRVVLAQMAFEPKGSEIRDALQRPRLLEEVRRSRDDDELALASKPSVRRAVQL